MSLAIACELLLVVCCPFFGVRRGWLLCVVCCSLRDVCVRCLLFVVCCSLFVVCWLQLFVVRR